MVRIVDPYSQDSLIAQLIEFSLHMRRGEADALVYLSDLESSCRLCPHLNGKELYHYFTGIYL